MLSNKLVIFLLLGLLFLSACKQIDLDELSDEDLQRISDKLIVCNKPYIRVAADCCLDANDNRICDEDETIDEKKDKEEKQKGREGEEPPEEEKHFVTVQFRMRSDTLEVLTGDLFFDGKFISAIKGEYSFSEEECLAVKTIKLTNIKELNMSYYEWKHDSGGCGANIMWYYATQEEAVKPVVPSPTTPGTYISPGKVVIDFEPNFEGTYHFRVGAHSEITITGELSQYVKMGEITRYPNGEMEFPMYVKLPEKLDTPGPNRVNITVREVPRPDLVTPVTVIAPIIINVPLEKEEEQKNNFSIELTPVKDNVFLNESAVFTLKVTSDMPIIEYFSIYSPDVRWSISTDPAKDINSLKVYPFSSSSTTLLIKPTADIKPGQPYAVPIRVRGTRSEKMVKDDKSSVVYVKSPTPFDGPYLPDIKVQVEIDDKVDPMEDIRIRLSLQNMNPRNITQLKIKLRSYVINKDHPTQLGPMETKTLEFTIRLNPLEPPRKDTLYVTVSTEIGNKTYSFEAEPQNFEIIN